MTPCGPLRAGQIRHVPSPTPACPGYPPAYVRPPYVAWADLLRRVFALDVLACPSCGGRLRLLATIGDRAVLERRPTPPRFPAARPQPAAARPPAWLPGGRGAAPPLSVMFGGLTPAGGPTIKRAR